MSDREVIKEFLVAIGFKLDEHTLSRFTSLTTNITKKVSEFAATLLAGAGAVELFVNRVADKMEDLYWASQRLRDSVGNIQDYALGISKLGGNAAQARSDMEGLMRLLRTNPGYGGLLASLGVNPRQGVTGIMEGLRQRFSRMPYFIAQQFASQLGISEDTLYAMLHSKGAVGGEHIYGGIYKQFGLNPEKIHEYSNAVADMEARWSAYTDVIAYKLLPVAQKLLDWSRDGTKWIADQVAAIKPETWKAWADQLEKVGKDVDKLAKSVGGLARAFGDLYAQLDKLAGNNSFINDMREFTSSLTNWTDALTALLKGDWKGFIEKAGHAIYEDTGGATNPKNNRTWGEWGRDLAAQYMGLPTSVSNASNPGNIRVPGQRAFQRYASVDDGLRAMANQLRRDIRVHGLDTLNAIFGDKRWGWAPASDKNNPGLYAKLVGNAAGIDPSATITPEILARILPSVIAMMTKVEGVNRGITTGQVARALHVTSNTTINVHSSASPHGVGREIAGQQGRVHGDLLRNLKPAVQ